MIKLEKTEIWGFEHAIRGARNPMNSWNKSDSCWYDMEEYTGKGIYDGMGNVYVVGKNDMGLMQRLIKASIQETNSHSKFLRQIMVSVDITAPLYWWKEFDTYKVGTTANSCSTMHKIHSKEFTLDDFSHEYLSEDVIQNPLKSTIDCLNFFRDLYNQHKNKDDWYTMIQLLPSSYNQKRTVTLNYQVIRQIYFDRRHHKLDEWSKGFMEWINTLPYADELIKYEAKE